MKTCVGSDYCRYDLGDSTALGIAIEERHQGLASPAKMKLAVTGCPRNCAEALFAYEHLRTKLRDDLGISPSPATQALHQRLLR